MDVFVAVVVGCLGILCFCKQKTAYEMRISDWSSDVCSSDLNLQYNWPKLESVPDILALLATVEMHAIQTSGNCIRNVTADHLAGVAPDELEDPRPWCE